MVQGNLTHVAIVMLASEEVAVELTLKLDRVSTHKNKVSLIAFFNIRARLSY